ncbi:MAG: head GIN domain-containing protein [Flavobacteriaceae bacterium]
MVLLLVLSCSTDSASDCLQNSGEVIRKEITIPNFSKITVFEKVGLVLKQGDVQKVEIETGENLLDEVSAKVEGNRLILKNENGCNLFRDYGLTTVYITSPLLSEIRSSTGEAIRSDGVLTYQNLELFSESFLDPEADTTDGEFNLQLDAQNLSIVVNGIAYFKLTGKTENLSLVIAAGDSRMEAEDLTAQNIVLDHRGSNDMFINPRTSVMGVIRGVGDVISFHRPDEVAVEERYKGKLIFKD